MVELGFIVVSIVADLVFEKPGIVFQLQFSFRKAII